jgi:colicin import membrane protein
MPPSKPPIKGRWRAIALSILLHSAIVAAAVYGWFTWKHSAPPVETLAIEANVVDESALKGVAPAPKPEPPAAEPVVEPEPPPPVEEQGPPKPDQAELERKEAERIAKEEQEKAGAGKGGAAEARSDQKAAQELKEREDAQRVEAEKQAAAKAAAEKAAAEKAIADKEGAGKEARRRCCRSQEGRRGKGAPRARGGTSPQSRGRSARQRHRNSDEAARWQAQIVARIHAGLDQTALGTAGHLLYCVGHASSGGEVTAVRVNSCSIDDAALRESVEAAVYRASPAAGTTGSGAIRA